MAPKANWWDMETDYLLTCEGVSEDWVGGERYARCDVCGKTADRAHVTSPAHLRRLLGTA